MRSGVKVTNSASNSMDADSFTGSVGHNSLQEGKAKDTAEHEVEYPSTAITARQSHPHQIPAIQATPQVSGIYNAVAKQKLDSTYTDTATGETLSQRELRSNNRLSFLPSDENTANVGNNHEKYSKDVDNEQWPSGVSHSSSSDQSSSCNIEGSGSSETDELCDRLNGSNISEERIAAPILDPARQAVADRIMAQFWVIFDQRWRVDAQQLAESPDQQDPRVVSFNQNSHRVDQGSFERKRTRDGDTSDQEGNDDDHRSFKRRNPRPETKSADTLRFACLFRKHNPSRYSIYSHRSCAQSAYPSISRLK